MQEGFSSFQKDVWWEEKQRNKRECATCPHRLALQGSEFQHTIYVGL